MCHEKRTEEMERHLPEPTGSSHNANLEAALRYAMLGWYVFPVQTPRHDGSCTCGNSGCSNIGKHPRTPHGFNDATIDPEQIRKWWTTRPEANIGVRTGPKSGLFALDVDLHSGGYESLDDLITSYGDLPDTLIAETGGGGKHYFFRHPDVPVRCSAGKLGSGLDVRGEGGYIIVAPSQHASGKGYVWELGSAPDEAELAEAPEWLLDELQGRGPELGEGSVGKTLLEGSRNESLTSLAGSMRRRGMSEEAIGAALQAENRLRCNPPLSEEEVQRIAHSVSRYAPAERQEQLDDYPEVPDHVFGLLPESIQRTLNCFSSKQQKTILLVARMAVDGACMPNVWTQMETAEYAPDVINFIIGPPASDKSIAVNYGKRIGMSVEQHLAGHAQEPVYPMQTRCLFLPGNTSASALIHGLQANGGSGCIVESESDVLNSATRQEWGEFKHLIRQAASHEDISINRVDGGRLWVANPRLSACITGTPDQCTRFLQSTENGLYSRINLFRISGVARPRSQRPSTRNAEREEIFEREQNLNLAMYQLLAVRSEKLLFELSPPQWERHDAMVEELFDLAQMEDDEYLRASALRAGISAIRFAMQFAVRRAFDRGVRLDVINCLVAEDGDVDAAIELTKVLVRHAFAFSRELAGGRKESPEKRMLELLPDTEYRRAEIVAAASRIGFKERSADTCHKRLLDRGSVVKVRHGVFRKKTESSIQTPE